jgi:hypothetical protein
MAAPLISFALASCESGIPSKWENQKGYEFYWFWVQRFRVQRFGFSTQNGEPGTCNLKGCIRFADSLNSRGFIKQNGK